MLKPVLDTPLGKVWTTPAELGSQRWRFGGPKF